MEIFARFGVSDTVVTDNGPQFSGADFAGFAQSWGFEHITSSPRFAQSNGKAENAVKTVKRLFRKCKIDNTSEFIALLNWRNTPSEGIEVSPAQRLFGRRCRTLLPTTDFLLKPRYAQEDEISHMRAAKAKQAYYYNRHAQPLKPLNHGDIVRMHLPPGSNKQWLGAGQVVGQVAPRSYEVEINGNIYRRNRHHLLAPKCSLDEGTAVQQQELHQHEPQQQTRVGLEHNLVDERMPVSRNRMPPLQNAPPGKLF